MYEQRMRMENLINFSKDTYYSAISLWIPFAFSKLKEVLFNDKKSFQSEDPSNLKTL